MTHENKHRPQKETLFLKRKQESFNSLILDEMGNNLPQKGNYAAKYLWRKGYEEAIKVLEPILIIRYGDKMPGEREEISVYFENINLKNLRNGR